MWVLVAVLAALAGVLSFGAAVHADRRGFVWVSRWFLLALMVASALVGAALQWGLG